MTRSELDVWVRGVYAGVLTARDGSVDFAYAEDYRDDRRTPSLSVSMPKIRDSHGDNVARRWIGNLLPDNDEVRERWAQHFDERRATAFNLLRHMGEDCAGAVQVMPRGQTPDESFSSETIRDADIERRLRVLRVDGWSGTCRKPSPMRLPRWETSLRTRSGRSFATECSRAWQ